MSEVNRQPHPVDAGEQKRLPFDTHFQQALLRLLCEDHGFGVRAVKHLRPEYFEHETLAWIYTCIVRHIDTYSAPPSVLVLQQMAGQLDPQIAGYYGAVIERVRQADLKDADWIKDVVLDFVQRNLFVRAHHESRALYNAGKADAAYDLMREQMGVIEHTTWDPVDRSFFYEELPQRLADRRHIAQLGDAIPTGFPWLDHILGGGLHQGELGVWQAYAKIGKTTMLVQHGMAANRLIIPILHIVLEGSRRLIENRYDSGLTGELYSNIKVGEMNARAYQLAMQEYEWMRGMLVVRGFVDQWDVNVLHIDEELKDLKRSRGFVPKGIIIDYADLMTGREKRFYKNKTESQSAAYRDVKRLAGHGPGYAIWTASQAQRPKKEDQDKAQLLTSSNVADAYEKVRACDFWGSLNQTSAEKSEALVKELGHQVARVYAEMYRDNAANQMVVMAYDPERMRIWPRTGLQSPSDPGATSEPSLTGGNGNGRPPMVQQAAFESKI